MEFVDLLIAEKCGGKREIEWEEIPVRVGDRYKVYAGSEYEGIKTVTEENREWFHSILNDHDPDNDYWLLEKFVSKRTGKPREERKPREESRPMDDETKIKITGIHDELARVLTLYEMEGHPEDEPPVTLDDVYDVAVWVQNRLAELLN